MAPDPYYEPGYIEPGYYEGDEEEGFRVDGRLIEIIGIKRLIEIQGKSRLIEIRGVSRIIEIRSGDQPDMYIWEEEFDPSEKKFYSVAWDDELAENGNEPLSTSADPNFPFFVAVDTAFAALVNITSAAVNPDLRSTTFEIEAKTPASPGITPGPYIISHTVLTASGQRYQRSCQLTVAEL
jgi:hypothetical protein